MNKSFTFSIILLLLSSIAYSLQSSISESSLSAYFAQYDSNSDGVVSKTQIVAMLLVKNKGTQQLSAQINAQTQLKEWDQNSNGVLEPIQFSSLMRLYLEESKQVKQREVKLYGEADKDANGLLSESQLFQAMIDKFVTEEHAKKAIKMLLKLYDINENGMTFEEYSQMKEDLRRRNKLQKAEKQALEEKNSQDEVTLVAIERITLLQDLQILFQDLENEETEEDEMETIINEIKRIEQTLESIDKLLGYDIVNSALNDQGNTTEPQEL